MKKTRPVQWKGSWIESDRYGGPQTAAPCPYFRHAFSLPARPVEARLHLCVLGLYEASVNGRLVHDTVLTPGWTVFDKRARYQTWDATARLRKGPNVIGVILGDGWYCGHLAINDRQNYGDRPRLLAQLEWRTADGQSGIVVSGTDWRTATGPILAGDLIMGETYDARRELAGWDTPGFDAADWTPARSASIPPEVHVQPHDDPFVRRHERFRGRRIDQGGPDARQHLYDLGQNIAGRVRLTVSGPRGSSVRIRHGEMLDAEGNLYTANLRGARATDVYTLKGGPPETWEPRFTFHGFRYVEITWTNPRPAGSIESIEGVALYADMPRTGRFECSHALLNRLYANTVWGQKGNFLEVPTDCPQRDERLGWTGDAQVFIRTAARNMDVSAFFRKWLRDMRDTQRPNGGIPPYIPFTASFGSTDDGGPAWGDAALICPMELYRAYGELDFLRDHYDCMAAYMAYLARNKVKDHIREHPDLGGFGGFGDWLALDGSGRVDGGTPKDLIGTAFYANNATIMAACAGRIGRQGDAKRWRELRRQVVRAFRRRFVTPEGLMSAGTQTACVLALHFDLLTPSQRRGATDQLVRLIEHNGMKIGTGFVGTPCILHVLEAVGRIDIAYRLLEQEAFPSWLFPVKQGATTIWERWDGWTPDKGFQTPGMNSFNHYAYGAVCDWMIGSVAGLEPAAPGYRRIRFKPRPGGSLTRAAASLETRYGTVAIAWKRTKKQLKLTLTVPAGTRAALDPPPGWQTDQNPFAPGTHTVVLTEQKQGHAVNM